jgi:tRNA A37 methylthiotransferase MiaB
MTAEEANNIYIVSLEIALAKTESKVLELKEREQKYKELWETIKKYKSLCEDYIISSEEEVGMSWKDFISPANDLLNKISALEQELNLS